MPWRGTVMLTALLGSLCACVGYRPSAGECQPGYRETALGDGACTLHVEAPGRSSRASLVTALERRAGELCPHGFAITGVVVANGACLHRAPVEFSYATARADCSR